MQNTMQKSTLGTKTHNCTTGFSPLDCFLCKCLSNTINERIIISYAEIRILRAKLHPVCRYLMQTFIVWFSKKKAIQRVTPRIHLAWYPVSDNSQNGYLRKGYEYRASIRHALPILSKPAVQKLPELEAGPTSVSLMALYELFFHEFI